MNEEKRKAALTTIEIWKQEGAAADQAGIGYGAEPNLPECPWHGEWLDDKGGCCLCEEQTGNPFAYQEEKNDV